MGGGGAQGCSHRQSQQNQALVMELVVTAGAQGAQLRSPVPLRGVWIARARSSAPGPQGLTQARCEPLGVTGT